MELIIFGDWIKDISIVQKVVIVILWLETLFKGNRCKRKKIYTLKKK